MRKVKVIYTFMAILLMSMLLGGEVEAAGERGGTGRGGGSGGGRTIQFEETKVGGGKARRAVEEEPDWLGEAAGDTLKNTFIVGGDIAVEMFGDDLELVTTILGTMDGEALDLEYSNMPTASVLNWVDDRVDDYENITYKEGNTNPFELMGMAVAKEGVSDVVEDWKQTKMQQKLGGFLLEKMDIKNGEEVAGKIVKGYDKAGAVVSALGDIKDIGEIIVSDAPDKDVKIVLKFGDLFVDGVEEITGKENAATALWNYQSTLWEYGMKTQEYKDFAEANRGHVGLTMIGITGVEFVDALTEMPGDIIDIIWGISTFFREGDKYENMTMWERFMGQSKPSSRVNVYKPNIYFYSDKPLNINVEFLQENLLTETIPEYSLGWDTYVNGDGKITCQNEKFDFLFYESLASKELAQKEQGWVIYADSREEQLLEILANYDFNEKEIYDFMEFWMEMLEENADYIMYPQNTLNVNIQMPIKINPMPDNITRIWFGFEKYQGQAVEEAEIVPIIRGKFTVVEWGGFFFE